ncbi:MAG: hypothetical protein M3N14_09835, partial [Bacteroidota bacterium]|nr:hypothetical protein [Bacteroidota bacterium]
MNTFTEQMFEVLFNQMAVPVSVIKADPPRFTIAAVNNLFKKTSRTPADEIVGKPAFEVFKPWDEASEKQFNLLKNGISQAIEKKQLIKLPVLLFAAPSGDGQTIEQTWWQFEINPILLPGNIVEYLMCTTVNVTSQELTRQSIERSKKIEQQLNNELKTVNGELVNINGKLTSTVEELRVSQSDLVQLNNELEMRIASRTQKLAENEKRSRSVLDALPQIAWTSTLK